MRLWARPTKSTPMADTVVCDDHLPDGHVKATFGSHPTEWVEVSGNPTLACTVCGAKSTEPPDGHYSDVP